MKTFSIVGRLACLAVSLGSLGIAQATAQDAEQKGQFSVVKEASGDVVVQLNGELFTRYVISDSETNKCYFYPVIGPGGLAMTRAYPQEDLAGEKQDHPHHRSIFFGLQEAGGFNTWHESLTFKGDPEKLKITGTQVSTELKASASEDGRSAMIVSTVENRNPAGEAYLLETRNAVFRLGEDGSRIIDLTIELEGLKESILIKGKKDSGLSVRVAHSMTVDAGEGGRVVNSAGDLDKAAWGKRAPWVDFNGPVKGQTLGLAILDHPDSFRHPTPWHARTYGLFTANPFALKEVAGEKESGDVELKRGQTVSLRYRLLFHRGDEKAARIAEAWEAFSKL